MAMTAGAWPSQNGPCETESCRDNDNRCSHEFHWSRANSMFGLNSFDKGLSGLVWLISQGIV
jgi:hypothetical protein